MNPYGAQIAGRKAELYVDTADLCRYTDIPWVHCTQAVDYQPYHWISRYPRPTSKLWNIRDLFTPGGWAFLLCLTPCIIFDFLHIAGVFMALFASTTFVKEELPLVPVRQESKILHLTHPHHKSITTELKSPKEGK